MVNRRYYNVASVKVPPLLEDGVVIVDVRRRDEWLETGVVAGSKLLTFFGVDGSSQPEEWLRQLNRLVPDKQQLLLI